jgi:hypothetical protein
MYRWFCRVRKSASFIVLLWRSQRAHHMPDDWDEWDNEDDPDREPDFV